jgi:hypothetical protein
MTTASNLSLALALAFGFGIATTGCAADSPDDGMGDDGTGGGGDEGGGDDAPRPMDAAGKYQVRSTFDIATNAPGKVGEVSNAIIQMTNDSTDPTDWILEQIIAKMEPGTLKNFATSAKPLVAGYLNDRLLQIAPSFVGKIVKLGNNFGQMTQNFGLNETLEVAHGGGAYNATVAAIGVHFQIDNVDSDVMFADNSVAAVTASNVAVGLDAYGKLDIAEHKLPLSYGKVLHLGLDQAIIPALDPQATNLNTLLTHLVNCQAVGVAINDALVEQFGIGGGAGTWQAACVAGLNYGAQQIYSKIDAIDSSALEFGLVGTSKAIDANHDGSVDTIQTGKWTGTLSYGGTPAPLASATFNGTRM